MNNPNLSGAGRITRLNPIGNTYDYAKAAQRIVSRCMYGKRVIWEPIHASILECNREARIAVVNRVTGSFAGFIDFRIEDGDSKPIPYSLTEVAVNRGGVR